jgi:pimeloyl-ACP methyl ester carboxylesterase
MSIQKMHHSHTTAETQFIDVGGTRYAYRRFGSATGTPLIFHQHFRGGMDHWDPLVTDGLAAGRPVVLFNNTGVASSAGETPDTVEQMAQDAVGFIRALGLTQVDLLGFSIGGYVAQSLVLQHPELVRRVVLAGSKPRAGDDTDRDPDSIVVATRNEVSTLEDFLFLFFDPSPSSQRAGRAFWERRQARAIDVDPPTSRQTMLAQAAALAEWRTEHGERYSELEQITQPVLVVNGHRDIMVPTVNSFIMAQRLPNAQLIVYPDSGHGSLFQYPELFVSHTARFLDSEVPFT